MWLLEILCNVWKCHLTYENIVRLQKCHVINGNVICGCLVVTCRFPSWSVKGGGKGCNFPHSWTEDEIKSWQKINKETQALNDTIDQIDLIDIYRAFHPKTADYTFFSSAYRIFSRIHHILGHKSSLGKFKKTEIMSSIFSNHNAMRLEINYREMPQKIWRLNNMLQ